MIIWLACNCYVWPIVAGHRVGRCGYCGERPTRRVDEPASRTAGPL